MTAEPQCKPFIQQAVAFEHTHQFSQLFLDYIANAPSLAPFYGERPELQAFEKQLAHKASFPQKHRQVLVDVLKAQYAGLNGQPNLDSLLDGNTFTVTTGHQLNIFSGPLYFIYKIASTINLAKKLAQAYPHAKFVPVYWMASEDHDFDEISYFSLFGQKHVWETEAKGAVGRLRTEGLGAIADSIAEMPAFFKEAYQSGQTLASATRAYVHALLGSEGLVVLDADSPQLKALFKAQIAADLFGHAPYKLASQATQALEALGYKSQIHAREINLFYLTDGLRERIERLPDGRFSVLHTAIAFSEAELRQEVEAHPERFSPNVVLRPLYQETVLPNLAYLGGPAEVAYWLQIKPIFDASGVPFPILLPRNFALVVSNANAKRTEKLGLKPEDLFLDEHSLKMLFLEHNASAPIGLEEESALLEHAFHKVQQKAVAIDATLEGAVAAELQKALKSLEHLEKRIRKSEERNQETSIRQLQALKEKLFPNGAPQERVENFLNFYLNDATFIQRILLAFDPLDFRMNVLIDA